MNFGLDSQYESNAVEHYIQMVDPLHTARVQNLYAAILSNSLPKNGSSPYISLDATTKQRYQDQAQQVHDILKANQQTYESRSSAQERMPALQNARIIVQFTTYFNSSMTAENYLEDTFMAENVEWIYDHESGDHPKIIVWAHDAHIANDTTYGTQDGRNMGGELRAHYGKSYLPIGTTLYQGTLRVYDNSPNTIQTLNPPNPDTYNYTLGQVGLPLYMIDLRNIPPGPINTWAHSSASLLIYGYGGQDLSTSALLSQWFDVIIHIQNTTPAKHF